MPILLSVSIITKNEQKNIARCIESVLQVADEVLVVDSGSEDNTVAIAEGLGARVLFHDFVGHIEQKNWASNQSAHEWVLSLDADEALSPELQASILGVKEMPLADVYELKRLSSYLGQWIRHSGWYPDRKRRLWKKGSAQWGGKNPHDKLLPMAKAKVGNLEGDLLHYTYYNLDEHLAQVNYFTSILALEDYKKGKRPSLLRMVLGGAYKFIKDFVLKKGFLDGYRGFLIAAISAFATFMKYAKLRELVKQEGK